MADEVRQIGSFRAKDAQGRSRVLSICQVFHHTPIGPIIGLQQIRTADGQQVNRRAAGRYQIAATGEALRSDDPNAP
jgi:hypothetical protein